MGAYSSLPAHEGTRLEAIPTWSSPGQRRRRCGAALGASIRQRIRAERGARARPWGPVRTHYEGLPSMAGRGGDEGRRKPPGEATGEEPGVSISARKHGSRDTNRRKLERRMASASRDAYRRKADSYQGCAVRRSSPSSFQEGQGNEGLPGADTRTRAMAHVRIPPPACALPLLGRNRSILARKSERVARAERRNDLFDVQNQPPPLEEYNLFSTDQALHEAVRREGAEWAEGRLTSIGGELGSRETIALGFAANRHPPVLHAF